jgi:hypothetical protein
VGQLENGDGNAMGHGDRFSLSWGKHPDMEDYSRGKGESKENVKIMDVVALIDHFMFLYNHKG